MSDVAALDLDAIREDVEMATRSPEMARHVALDHAPELVAEVERLREEKLGLEISESNLVVQLRAENERLRAAIERVETLAVECRGSGYAYVSDDPRRAGG
ncbi:hypothetical protein SEA_SMURPH_56 [Mycobacterium phage Smurph]|uniref:Uncharacterized protein n=7 Tax=Charlievirus Pipsqueaks TaxID=2169810 RepID=A0A142K7X7_9CAUD|nr:hypothetical protein AVV74_gp56 [Mycobacterium phage Carcharodon]YP_009616910.1 hypothetical protein FDI84_gp57 [Mycobacterium phage Pipsqueaks]AMS02002.1 hypothetical protein SEA_XERXES_56 [Mycobacterium phage Xerxes]AXQ52626.1 hypothetical protein SEA_GEX_57 [Mycobacterium phage Gex]QBI98612.1 hypothetical protein SEA_PARMESANJOHN_56 [Mycobacterium phage Parmesanjohn]QBI99012.1 hypothetical protein SEA_SMURPH_56 [Mycobacterium phage Smurph]QNJ57589.1 hypothetical protein SEA_SCHNAUZER_57